MAGVDQRAKILRRTKPAGRRIQAGRLIAPGAVERVFVDGKKFDVGKTEIAHITRQLLRQVSISQPLVVVLAPPRTEMHLIDRHWRAKRVDIGGRGAGVRQVWFVAEEGGRRRGAS